MNFVVSKELHPNNKDTHKIKTSICWKYGNNEFSNLNHLTKGGHEIRQSMTCWTAPNLTERFDFNPADNLLSLSEQERKSRKNNENKLANIKGNRLTLQGDRKPGKAHFMRHLRCKRV